jgi:tryptophan-rich sensory protein
VRLALTAYAVQLGLNLSWSFVFFGAQQVGAALAVIAALLAAILANAWLFWRIDRAAGLLLMPYAAWVSFATLLNAAIWRLN